MLFASGMAIALKPNARVQGQQGTFVLKDAVPEHFGDWRQDDQQAAMVVNPQQSEMLSQIYSDVLMRTYVDGQGRRVMLSISYGSDQTGRLRVHRPESCYTAQGFKIDFSEKRELSVDGFNLATTRLVAHAGARYEPITYWIRVGHKTVGSLLGQRMAQLSYGLTGTIPDGLIFRVSSIGPNRNEEFDLQRDFLKAMYEAMSPENRVRFYGEAAPVVASVR
jgi:EpsI family protein